MVLCLTYPCEGIHLFSKDEIDLANALFLSEFHHPQRLISVERAKKGERVLRGAREDDLKGKLVQCDEGTAVPPIPSFSPAQSPPVYLSPRQLCMRALKGKCNTSTNCKFLHSQEGTAVPPIPLRALAQSGESACKLQLLPSNGTASKTISPAVRYSTEPESYNTQLAHGEMPQLPLGYRSIPTPEAMSMYVSQSVASVC